MNDDFLESRLAAVAAAVADKTRATMLCALMDGRAYTATELSVVADVAASTASSHLARLLEQHLIDCVPQGRHRYFRIASRQVAEALEALMGLVGSDKATIRSKTPDNLRFARTCYDHMAGEVAVALHDRFIGLGWLHSESYHLSDDGKLQLSSFGVNCEPSASRRRFACACLDWSERQSHLGGQLGAALLQAFERQRWVIRQLDSRELLLTANGRKALSNLYGLTFH
ncbi:transcriptional regulator [Aquitalea sp. S1-19]|nr:transcriptional regulator [Aquitalea sp. S1-19]